MITVPRPVGADAPYYDVQRIEPGMGGVAELKEVIENLFGHQIKRYILGQTLTTEASATGLGSNLADVQLETFMLHVRYDAILLSDSLTEEVVEPHKRYNFPHHTNVRYRYVIDTESPNAQLKMEAMQRLFQMGMPIRGEDLRELVGATRPTDADEVVSMVELQKEMAATQPQPGADPAQEGPTAQPGMPEQPDADVGQLTANPSPVGLESTGYSASPGTADRVLLEASDGKKLA